MFRLRHAFTILFAAAAVAASSAIALAAPMQILTTTNVYEAPDPNSVAKYTLQAGSVHDVNCGSIGWCFVDTPVGGGYIPGSVVGAAPAQPQPPPGGGGGNNPGFSLDFNFGNNSPPRRFDAEVCFYTNTNFRGRSFCAEPGDANNRLSSNWNDAISSIEITGDIEVEVCTDRNMRGTCTVIRRDTARLNSRVNDSISSFEVY